MLQEYSRKIDESYGIPPFPMEANQIARFLIDNDQEYDKRSPNRLLKYFQPNRILRFFQRRDLAFMLVASILAFACILLGFGITIMWTGGIP
jgi:hypothetical protein